MVGDGFGRSTIQKIWSSFYGFGQDFMALVKILRFWYRLFLDLTSESARQTRYCLPSIIGAPCMPWISITLIAPPAVGADRAANITAAINCSCSSTAVIFSYDGDEARRQQWKRRRCICHCHHRHHHHHHNFYLAEQSVIAAMFCILLILHLSKEERSHQNLAIIAYRTSCW